MKYFDIIHSLHLKTIEEIKKSEKISVKVTQKVTANQQKILDAIKINPYVTQEELDEIVGIARKKYNCKYEKTSRKRINKTYRCR